MTTDAAFGYPSDRQLKLQSRVAPSYQYIFGYRSTNTSSGFWEGTEWAGTKNFTRILFDTAHLGKNYAQLEYETPMNIVKLCS